MNERVKYKKTKFALIDFFRLKNLDIKVFYIIFALHLMIWNLPEMEKARAMPHQCVRGGAYFLE